ncbi:uncharacterized protein MAM_07153 [Metarhizium album ARSEF 1941]|uniref:Uncharacterized protein n=1 Tax=Metarhizium album (strain ARSEF 1941) TaxID=1081103 RepID=A0A0B2WG17_METAS|nr:uncharacterized protein MAM_07153 [Metarhizium album ARSEF 1941]KHN94926.1 hypothetical protein MAM_07153 [Metarhizium album ARSEF 1941]
MTATASELKGIFRPHNEWDDKIAARLTDIWVNKSASWTEKTRMEFKALCADARITRGTITPSSHKIHRKIRNRKATEAEYTVLSAMFGSQVIQRLVLGVENKEQDAALPLEMGVITQEIRKLLRTTWGNKTDAPGLARSPTSSIVEVPTASMRQRVDNENELQSPSPKENASNAPSFSKALGIQIRLNDEEDEENARHKGDVKSHTAALRGMEPGVSSDGVDDGPARHRTGEAKSTMPSFLVAGIAADEAADWRAQREARKGPGASRKRKPGRTEGPPGESPSKRTPQTEKDPWETLQRASPTKELREKLEALEGRCAAQDERMARIEETFSSQDEQLKTLRQQIDTVARYLTRNA